MTTEKFLPYGRQSIDAFDLTDLSEAISADIITRGARVQDFEAAIAAEVGARYAVAFCNGTAALEAAYFAADLKPYDRVVSSPNTFVGSVVTPLKLGADLVFCDIDRRHGGMSVESAEPSLHFRSTRGKLVVVPVHFAGITLDVHRIRSIARHPSSMIIEDAAHAIGSTYPSGEKVGSCAFSDMTVFSFHPVKTITTGEGGMVTTNDPALKRRLELFRNNGIVRPEGREPWYYEVHAATGNYNITDFQAALGLSQFGKLREFSDKRRSLVQEYRRLLAGIEGIRLFDEEFDERTTYHLMVLQIDFAKFGVDRATLMQRLQAHNIGTQVHYIPLYHHPVCQVDLEEAPKFFPETESYYASALSLPLYPTLSLEDVAYVCDTLKEQLAVSSVSSRS